MLKISDETIEIIADGIVNLIRKGRLLKEDAEGGDGWQGKGKLEELWYSYIKRVDPHEKEYIEITKNLLTKQAKEVFDNIKKYPNDYKKWMFDRKKWLRVFTEAEAKFIVKLYKQEGQKAIDLALKLSRKSYYKAEEIPISIAFDVYNPEVTDELIKQTTRFPAGVVGTSEEIIRKEIANGLELGESIYELRKRVTERLGPTYIKNRAEMIARSETIYASNAGAELGYMQSGVVEGKKWLTAVDERTCNLCLDMNGRTAILGSTFDIESLKADYGWEFDYTEGEMPFPPLHPRCRCTITPIVKAIKKPRLGNLRISDKNAVALKREQDINNLLLDKSNLMETASDTKERIAMELTEKLSDNKDFMKYLRREWPIDMELTPDRIERTIEELIRNWAGTSGDADPKAIAMQMAAQAEFGLTNVALKHLTGSAFKEAQAIFARDGKGLQALLRAQYNLTQEFFKKNGITRLTGYRGIRYTKKVPGYKFGKEYKIVEGKLQLQPISSLSTDLFEADQFAGTSYQMLTQGDVPISRILSTCQTGFGCKSEAEFVILGGEESFKIATGKGVLIREDAIFKLFGDFKVAPK